MARSRWLVAMALAGCCAIGIAAGEQPLVQPARNNQGKDAASATKGGTTVGNKPLGVVTLALSGYLDHQKLDRGDGTTVYAGDSFYTDTGGTVRMRLGTSYIGLLSHSGAVVTSNDGKVHVTVGEGTVQFTSTVGSPVEIETPIALIHASVGQNMVGDVTLLGPDSIKVSDRTGTVIVEHEGEQHPLIEGKAFNVSLESDEAGTPAAGAAAQDAQGAGTESHHHKKRLIFDAVLLGAGAVTAGCLWGTAESPSSICSPF